MDLAYNKISDYLYTIICYDLSYELRLHSGKDLRRDKGWYKSGKV